MIQTRSASDCRIFGFLEHDVSAFHKPTIAFFGKTPLYFNFTFFAERHFKAMLYLSSFSEIFIFPTAKYILQ